MLWRAGPCRLRCCRSGNCPTVRGRSVQGKARTRLKWRPSPPVYGPSCCINPQRASNFTQAGVRTTTRSISPGRRVRPSTSASSMQLLPSALITSCSHRPTPPFPAGKKAPTTGSGNTSCSWAWARRSEKGSGIPGPIPCHPPLWKCSRKPNQRP